jgi:D-amino peptidase
MRLPIIFLSLFISTSGICEAQKPKILISVDMEGIGALARDQFGPSAFEYQKGRQLMTAETNAAIEGCLEAGAGEILVADAHGNAQNLIPDELHEAAMLIRAFPRPMMQVEGVDESFAGVIYIGYHPKDGTPTANLSHTFMGGTIFEIKINGTPVSESIFNAAVVGSMGVPVIMVAGDQNITKEAIDTFGPVETVVTKESIGWYSAKSRHPRVICREIKEKAKKAVERIAEMKPFTFPPPLEMEITFKNIYDAETWGYLPWVERTSGKTIVVESDNMPDLNRFITALYGVNRRR